MPAIEDIEPRGKRNIATKLKFSDEFQHQQQPSKRAKKSTKDVTCKKIKSPATSKITSLDIKIYKPDTSNKVHGRILASEAIFPNRQFRECLE